MCVCVCVCARPVAIPKAKDHGENVEEPTASGNKCIRCIRKFHHLELFMMELLTVLIYLPHRNVV